MHAPKQNVEWFWPRLSRTPDRRRLVLRRGCSRVREPSAARIAASARFGVATSDNDKVWARMVGACKAKVVNETLPTRCCGITRCTKAASQAAFQNRAEFFFKPMTPTAANCPGG